MLPLILRALSGNEVALSMELKGYTFMTNGRFKSVLSQIDYCAGVIICSILDWSYI